MNVSGIARKGSERFEEEGEPSSGGPEGIVLGAQGVGGFRHWV